MALATITRAVLRQRLAGSFGLRGLLTGTATDGTAVQSGTELVDARNGSGLKDSAYGASRFDQAYLAIWGGTHTTALESARVLTAGYSPAEGKITVGRTFATTPVTGLTTYELHTHGLTPDELNDALRWATRNAERCVHWTLTGLVADGNMEDSGVTEWAVTSATRAKTTTEAQVGRGAQALTVTNTGANGYASSNTAIPVYEGRQYRVMALVRVTTGVADVVVRDLTNGANVTVQWSQASSIDAADGTDWRFLTGTFEVPAGCVTLELRLRNSSASGVAHWDDVCQYPLDDLDVALPTWVLDPIKQLIDVYTAAYVNTNRGAYRLEKVRPLRKPVGDPSGATAWRLPVPSLTSRPIVIRAMRPLGELTTEAGTVPADLEDHLLAGALYQCFQMGARPRGMDAAEFAAERRRVYGDWLGFQANADPRAREGWPVWSAV